MKKFEKILATIKTIAKYGVNILVIVDALLLGLAPIWNIPCADKISATISVICGVLGTYLIGNKTVSTMKKGKE